MKCTEPGHTYELEDSVWQPGTNPVQTLQFIHKEEDNGELVSLENGTTNEEVLRVLIDRMKWLQDKLSCNENALVIRNLEQSLMLLERRTNGRVKRCVKGTPKR